MESLVRGQLMGIDPTRIQEMIIRETKELLAKGQDEVMAQFRAGTPGFKLLGLTWSSTKSIEKSKIEEKKD